MCVGVWMGGGGLIMHMLLSIATSQLAPCRCWDGLQLR